MKYLEDDIKFFSRVVSASESGVIASAEQIKDYTWNNQEGAFQSYINEYFKSQIDGFEPITKEEIIKDL